MNFAGVGIVKARDLASNHWTAGEEGVLHSSNAKVDAKLGGTVGLGGCIEARCGCSDELVLRPVFELRLLGNRKLGGALGEVAVAGAAARCSVEDETLVGSTFGGGYVPLLGRCRDEHLARGGTGLPHRIPSSAHAGTASSGLVAKESARAGLLDGNLRPVGIEFLGEDHG